MSTLSRTVEALATAERAVQECQHALQVATDVKAKLKRHGGTHAEHQRAESSLAVAGFSLRRAQEALDAAYLGHQTAVQFKDRLAKYDQAVENSPPGQCGRHQGCDGSRGRPTGRLGGFPDQTVGPALTLWKLSPGVTALRCSSTPWTSAPGQVSVPTAASEVLRFASVILGRQEEAARPVVGATSRGGELPGWSSGLSGAHRQNLRRSGPIRPSTR